MRPIKRNELKEISELIKKDKQYDEQIYLLAYALCDEKGERLYSLDDIEELGEKEVSVVSLLIAAANEVNNLTEERIEALKKSFAENGIAAAIYAVATRLHKTPNELLENIDGLPDLMRLVAWYQLQNEPPQQSGAEQQAIIQSMIERMKK